MLSAVLVIAFVFIFRDPLIGALSGLLAAYAAVVAYWFWKGRYRFAFRVHLGTTRALFLTGMPLITIFIGEAILLSIDRWIVAARLGRTILGHYAIGIMASNMIALVPSALASVLYTKMLERHGALGNPVALCGLYAAPMRAMAALMSVLIGGSVLLLPFLFRFFLPKYIPSIEPLRIVLLAAFFYSSTFIPASLLVSINRHRWMLIIQAVLIPIAVVLYSLVIDKGWGIVGVAGCTAVLYALFGFGYLFFAAYYVFEQRAHLVRFLAEIIGVFMAMVAGLAFCIMAVPEGASLAGASLFLALRFAVFSTVLFPVLWWLNRDGDIAGILRETLLSRFGLKNI
jgi:O-antigen/teichoic acid export membrane protein